MSLRRTARRARRDPTACCRRPGSPPSPACCWAGCCWWPVPSRWSTRRPRWRRSARTSCCRPGWKPLVGWGLPFVEVALGLLLLAGIATRPVAAAVGPADAGLHRRGGLGRGPRAEHRLRLLRRGRRGAAGPDGVRPGDRPGLGLVLRPAGWSRGRRAAGAWSGPMSAAQPTRPGAGPTGRGAGGGAAPGASDPGRGAGRVRAGAGRRRDRVPGLADQPSAVGAPRPARRRSATTATITDGRPIVFGSARGTGDGQPVRGLPLPALRRVRGGVRRRAHPSPAVRAGPGRAVSDGLHRRGFGRGRQRHGLRGRGRLRPQLLRRAVRQPHPAVER